MRAACYRLGAVLLLAVTLGMIWTPAHASFPATSGTEYQAASGTWYPTLLLAAQNSVGPQFKNGCTGTSYYPSVFVDIVPPSSYHFYYEWCQGGNVGTGVGNIASVATRTALSCPLGATLSGSTCTCSAGYNQVGSTCVSQQSQDDAACKANADGLNYLGAPLVHYGSVGLTACFGGFSVTGSGAASGGGQTELYGPFKCTGAHASSCSVVPKPADIAVTCAQGSYPGTVNGVQVCVPPQSTVDTPKTTTATPPTPGASAPQISDAPAGTTSQSEQTTCTGTTCTKTIIYKDASGNPTGSKTEEQSKAGYCAENPKAPGCTPDKSSFGGSCAGGFTYEGDALLGALAKEVHVQYCKDNSVTQESQLYDQEKVKTGNQTLSLPGNETKNISPASFDQSDSIGGAQCIGDLTISILGSLLVLPFSGICPHLLWLKYALLACSFLVGYKIIMRG